MSLWDDVKTNLGDWYAVTSDKTAEVAKVTSRRYDKFGISRDVERQFSELGSLVYNGLQEGRENILEDPELEGLVGRIRELETELHNKDEEIESIKAQYRRTASRAAAAAGGGVDTDTEVDAAEMVLTDPVLEPGTEDSAILVEPAEMPKPEVEADIEADDSDSGTSKT